VLAERLANQKLTDSTLRKPEEIVGWLGAVQAQDYIGAKWALALRGRDLTDTDIERAFAAGRILRTHVLRPTWHFVTPGDIAWMLALTGPRVQRLNRGYARALELDDRTLVKARRVVERVLEAGTPLTREELSGALRRARIEATGQRLGFVLIDLELQAVICSGPRRGKEFTYALFSERVPVTRGMTRDEALAQLATRFFQSHGPATLRDFAWWSGMTVRDAKAAALLARVEPLTTPLSLQIQPGASFLLPNYDEYLIAYRDRSAVIDPGRTRNLGVFTSHEYPHQLVIDGRVAGSWRRTITEKALTVEVWPYRKLTSAQRTIVNEQASRYGDFLQLPLTLRLT
jgi:hypothetical protein